MHLLRQHGNNTRNKIHEWRNGRYQEAKKLDIGNRRPWLICRAWRNKKGHLQQMAWMASSILAVSLDDLPALLTCSLQPLGGHGIADRLQFGLE
jgi:hypothetical protein